MPYSQKQIDKYLSLLKSYKESNSSSSGVSEGYNPSMCRGCSKPLCRGVSGGCNPPVYMGQHICDSCGVFNGYVLGYFDLKERERLFYKKKSIYNRKYHYEKKVYQISKRLKLTDEESCRLYNELMKIDDHIMKIQNKKFGRKRMINIFYLIKKILQKMGDKKHKLVYLKISSETLKNYEEWWNSYISIKD